MGIQRLVYLDQSEKSANYSALLRFPLLSTKLVQGLCRNISDDEKKISGDVAGALGVGVDMVT